MNNDILSGIQFPPSIQSDLFNLLRPEQQEFVKPILRVLKGYAQIELCGSLINYLKTGVAILPTDVALGGFFMFLTRAGMEDVTSPEDSRILLPLVTCEPKHTCAELARTTCAKFARTTYGELARTIKQMFHNLIPTNHD